MLSHSPIENFILMNKCACSHRFTSFWKVDHCPAASFARRMRDGILTAACLLVLPSAVLATPVGPELVFQQLGPELPPSGRTAISGDGNTAVVCTTGGTSIYTRANGTFSQQGATLAGGSSVAISADSNTVLVGQQSDNANRGTALVFVRSSGVWSQQGSKLLPSDSVYTVSGLAFGISVSLSADGNTALVGGLADNNGQGASWVFTRSSGSWTQQGSKLVASDASGGAQEGSSVALSADGNTALVGGSGGGYLGAGEAYVYTRSNGSWSQVGSKFTPSDDLAGVYCEAGSCS
jgi:hypothetical protein